MKKQAKKGFTIVELVIVIALIAILAAVLIPTFSNVINNAHESSDTMMVKNLNTILNSEEVNGNRAETMQEAIDQAEEGGYKVDKLTPTSSGDIVWDQESNRFLLVNAKKEVVYKDESATGDVDLTNGAYKLWKITRDATKEDKGYSLYLANGAVAPAGAVEVGVDAGVNENVAVNFASAAERDVIIRTNGGTLNVNAEKATVSHFGEAEKVVIAAVAGNSYHEHGKVVGNIEIAKGRVEVAAKAEVGTIIVKSVAAGDGKVEVVTGATVKAVAPATEAAKTDVTAATGVADNVKHEEIVTNTDKFAGGLGTEASPYLIANGEQFANMNDFAAEMVAGKSYFFKQIKDIVVTRKYSAKGFAGTYDGDGYKITVDLPDGKFVSLFSVYQTTGFVCFKNINIVMSNVGVNLLSCADWGTAYGATFDNIVFNSTQPVVKVNCSNFGFVVIDALYTKGEESPVYTFSNITNNVNLQNEGTCTGFIVGSGPDFSVKTTVNYINCVNNGTITGTSSVGFLYGNSSYIKTLNDTESVINVTNCKNNAIFKTPYENPIVAFAPKCDELNEKYQEAVGGSFLANNYLKDKTVTINQDGSSFTLNTTVKYKLVFNVAATYWTKDGHVWTAEDVALIGNGDLYKKVWEISNGRKFTVELPADAKATGVLNKTIKAYDKKTAEANGIVAEGYIDGFAIVVKNSVTYLVFDVEESTYINSNVSLLVYAYDANDELLGIRTVK